MIEHILLIKILIPTFLAFIIGIGLTPFFSHIFYKYRLWKRSSRSSVENTIGDLELSEDFKKIHNAEAETKTPRVGGIIVWSSVILTAGLMIFLSRYGHNIIFEKGNFITRNQTLIPFVSLLLGAGLGLIDDFLQIFGGYKSLIQGIPRKFRIGFVLLVGILEGVWFYQKLGYSDIALPFTDHVVALGPFFILFYVVVILALFSSSIIDGIDGLAGGVLTIIFSSYGFIGLIQNQSYLATFCFVIVGAMLAFLWFNVPPARFYLGETGILALTLSLSVIIFLTDTVLEFLIIGLPLVITAGSSLLQIISRRVFHRKLFRVAPFHHHLEAIGWSREKITMRYWIFSVACSALGIIIVIIG